jgi:hypothetical protein
MPLGSFRLNGLSKRLAPAISFANATGGTTSTYTADGKTYRVHRFNSNGTFTVTAPGLVDILLVGGGAGAFAPADNSWSARGGNSGSAVQQLEFSVAAQSYSLVVGAGGTHRDPFSSPSTEATSGVASTGFGFTAAGGAVNTSQTANVIESGGSGAGGAASGGTGGIGFLSSITGTATRYGGGGGGGSNTSTGGAGGAGGGGRGRADNGALLDEDSDGQPNTGGGGGGGTQYYGTWRIGGNGGSGVVIVRYQIA